MASSHNFYSFEVPPTSPLKSEQATTAAPLNICSRFVAAGSFYRPELSIAFSRLTCYGPLPSSTTAWLLFSGWCWIEFHFWLGSKYFQVASIFCLESWESWKEGQEPAVSNQLQNRSCHSWGNWGWWSWNICVRFYWTSSLPSLHPFADIEVNAKRW